METITIETRKRMEFVPITDRVLNSVRACGLQEGAVLVYVPHTTAGITLNENADPDVAHDLMLAFSRTAPAHADFRHSEGNSDAHMRATLAGSSVMIPVTKGHLALGTWQGVFFCEFDGPRRREVLIQPLASPVVA